MASVINGDTLIPSPSNMKKIPMRKSPILAIPIVIHMITREHTRIVSMKIKDKKIAAPADTAKIGHPFVKS